MPTCRTLLTRVAVGAALSLVAVTGLGACGGGSSAKAGAATVRYTLGKGGCTPSTTSVAAGPTTFSVSNTDGDQINEAELVAGSRILAERENLTPGLDGTFSYDLTPGTYALKCLGGSKQERQSVALTVTAAGVPAAASSRPAADAALLARASAGYSTYARAQAAQLVTATEALVAAIDKGDLGQARALYVAARVPYERIEPVAESFGTLDPSIDERSADVADPASWTGFHKVEQVLFQQGTTRGLAPVTTRLVADVGRLRTLVGTTTFQPAQLGNGATTLLDEVAKTKITGEEEAYSHVDLVDFQANVDGARQAFTLLEPALRQTAPAMATQITERFAAVDAALQALRTGGGPTDFKPYSAVTDADRKGFTAVVDALAEPLAQVAGTVVS